jgi:hypothetical protein
MHGHQVRYRSYLLGPLRALANRLAVAARFLDPLPVA